MTTDHASIAQLSKLFGMMRMVDLAPKLERGIPRWPTHPHIVIDKTITHEHDGYYCQGLNMGEHSGCHVDAPAHNHPGLATVEQIDIGHLMAPAVLYDFASLSLQPGDLISAETIEAYERDQGIHVGHGEIALINFGWMKRYWRCDRNAQWYALNAPGMTEDAVILLKERGIRAVGSDTVACDISIVDGVAGEGPGHKRHWLPNGILIIEMLTNLELLAPRSFFLAAALKIDEGSGSPLRPVALCER